MCIYALTSHSHSILNNNNNNNNKIITNTNLSTSHYFFTPYYWTTTISFRLYLLLGDMGVEISEMDDFGGFASLLLGLALGLDGTVIGASLAAHRGISVAVRIHGSRMTFDPSI